MNTPDAISHFVKIPKDVILEKSIPEHRASVFLYLHCNQTWRGNVLYTPIYMISWCGYTPNWHRGNHKNIFTKFRDCMNWYHDNGYIADFNNDEYVGKTFQSSKLNEEKMNPDSNFGIIYDFEVEMINSYESSYKPLNKSILLLLLSYIRAFTWIRPYRESGCSAKAKKEKPEIFCSNYKTIADVLGISRVMISKAADVLEKLGLIKTHKMSRYLDSDGNWHTRDTMFVCPYKYVFKKSNIVKCTDEEYDYMEELKNGIAFLSENKYDNRKFIQS